MDNENLPPILTMNGHAPNEIWLWSDGQATGPFESREIQRMFVAGELEWKNLASADGKDWKELQELLRETWEATDAAQQQQPPLLTRRSANAFPWQVWAGLLVGFAALGFGMKTGLEQLLRDWKPNRYSAYDEAVAHLKEKLVGARTFSPIEKCLIIDHGSDWTVDIRVEGLNVFGGPARSDYTVRLEAGQTCFYVRGVDKH